jgi:hypothetical protein
MFFQKIQKNLISEHRVEVSALEGRQSPTKVPFQNGVDCATGILEDVIVKDYVTGPLSAFAFYPGKHFSTSTMRS